MRGSIRPMWTMDAAMRRYVSVFRYAAVIGLIGVISVMVMVTMSGWNACFTGTVVPLSAWPRVSRGTLAWFVSLLLAGASRNGRPRAADAMRKSGWRVVA